MRREAVDVLQKILEYIHEKEVKLDKRDKYTIMMLSNLDYAGKMSDDTIRKMRMANSKFDARRYPGTPLPELWKQWLVMCED